MPFLDVVVEISTPAEMLMDAPRVLTEIESRLRAAGATHTSRNSESVTFNVGLRDYITRWRGPTKINSGRVHITASQLVLSFSWRLRFYSATLALGLFTAWAYWGTRSMAVVAVFSGTWALASMLGHLLIRRGANDFAKRLTGNLYESA